jgi:hypothetical protein
MPSLLVLNLVPFASSEDLQRLATLYSKVDKFVFSQKPLGIYKPKKKIDNDAVAAIKDKRTHSTFIP